MLKLNRCKVKNSYNLHTHTLKCSVSVYQDSRVYCPSISALCTVKGLDVFSCPGVQCKEVEE